MALTSSTPGSSALVVTTNRVMVRTRLRAKLMRLSASFEGSQKLSQESRTIRVAGKYICKDSSFDVQSICTVDPEKSVQ